MSNHPCASFATGPYSGRGLVFAGCIATTAQAPPFAADATHALVERAGQDVEAYEKDFGAVVCEESQVQKLIRADGRLHQQRDSKSDLATGEIWHVVDAGGVPRRD